MQRRRPARRTDLRSPATWLDESQTVEPSDFVDDPDATIKVEQIGAASEEDVLTVIYNLAGSRMLIRRCSAADKRPALE